LSCHTGLAVIESRWFPKQNTSVRGLFDLLADLNCDTTHAYHYEMAMSEPALKESLARLRVQSGIRHIYVATHGDKDGIHLANGSKLTRTELRNCLSKLPEERSRLDGVYFGSCNFVGEEFAEYFFDGAFEEKSGRMTSVKWVAGYSTEVDWVESSALDFLFFNKLLHARGEYTTEAGRLRYACEEIRKLAGGWLMNLALASLEEFGAS
jgi:hypothetical protein